MWGLYVITLRANTSGKAEDRAVATAPGQNDTDHRATHKHTHMHTNIQTEKHTHTQRKREKKVLVMSI